MLSYPPLIVSSVSPTGASTALLLESASPPTIILWKHPLKFFRVLPCNHSSPPRGGEFPPISRARPPTKPPVFWGKYLRPPLCGAREERREKTPGKTGKNPGKTGSTRETPRTMCRENPGLGGLSPERAIPKQAAQRVLSTKERGPRNTLKELKPKPRDSRPCPSKKLRICDRC